MLLLSSIGRQLRCLWCDVRSPHCGHLAHTPTRLQYHRIFAIQQYNPSKKSFGSTSSTTQSNKSNSNVNGTVTLPDSRARRVSNPTTPNGSPDQQPTTHASVLKLVNFQPYVFEQTASFFLTSQFHPINNPVRDGYAILTGYQQCFICEPCQGQASAYGILDTCHNVPNNEIYFMAISIF